jgi:organic radical activating enzyme
VLKNHQRPEKVSTRSSLEVRSIFYTIQGEGPFAGTPAVFVRLAGCNLQCPNCDTDYTSVRSLHSPDEIVAKIKDLMAPGLVVITGGEPFRQNITALLRQLFLAGYYIQVETNGTLPSPRDVFWSINIGERYGRYLVCSPKTGMVHKTIQANACAFKYVASAKSLNKETGLPDKALGHPAHPHLYRHASSYSVSIYLQPEDSQDAEENLENQKAVIEACLKFGYILQLQLHKIIGLA